MTDDWKCPKCGSSRVRIWGYWRSVGTFLSVVFGGLLFLILGAIFWPAFIISGVLFVLSLAAFIPLFVKMKHCLDCKHSWKIEKKQIKAS